MRKVTEQAIKAFYQRKPFKSSNTTVEIHNTTVKIKLYGHCIASTDETNQLTISTCGYHTATTKERLNGLHGVSVKTAKGQLYLNGKEWSGESTNITKLYQPTKIKL